MRRPCCHSSDRKPIEVEPVAVDVVACRHVLQPAGDGCIEAEPAALVLLEQGKGHRHSPLLPRLLLPTRMVKTGVLRMASDTPLEEHLKAFAARAKRYAPMCDNEEQTKVSLINPYLEILGYDVRNPAVCRLEYRADISRGAEKVDYAILRDGRPLILIEAKVTTSDISRPGADALGQLQRYFMSEKVEFAALTNGVVWQWYRGSQEGMMKETPFLVHDVRAPEVAEMPWLRSVAGPHFDAKTARDHAEAASIASAIMSWIEEARHRPSDDLVRAIIREKKLGQANAARVERVRQSFVATFEAYMDRETDRLLDAARGQQREEPPVQSEPSQDAPPSDEEARDVDLGDGSAPLRQATKERAWRVKGEAWKREPTGRNVLVAVLRYLSSIDGRGRHRFYNEAVTKMGAPMFSDTADNPNHWRQMEPGIEKFVKVHRSNKDMEQVIRQACTQCRPSTGAAIRFGEDIEVLLDL